MNKTTYEIRELVEDDLIKLEGHELAKLLGAPSRYQNFDHKWYCKHLRNYENAIRCCITDENNCIVGIILFSEIDFINGSANVFLHLLAKTEQRRIFRLSLNAILNFAGKSLNLKSLILHTSHNYGGATICSGFQEIGKFCGEYWYCIETLEHIDFVQSEFDIINANLSTYCIDIVNVSAEKKYILEYFDKDMYHPISCNPSADKIRSNIITSADMLLAYNQELLGFIAFYANDSATGNAYIASIVVSQKTQHQGIGRALMNRCKNVVCMRGMKSIRLEVSKNNEKALGFYESLGYIFDGIKSKDSLFFKHSLK